MVRRLVICGMHVHVGLDDDDLRIDLLGQAPYFLPHLLALSTSSPFWQGERNGSQIIPAVRVRRIAAHGPAGHLRQLQRISSAHATSW